MITCLNIICCWYTCISKSFFLDLLIYLILWLVFACSCAVSVIIFSVFSDTMRPILTFFDCVVNAVSFSLTSGPSPDFSVSLNILLRYLNGSTDFFENFWIKKRSQASKFFSLRIFLHDIDIHIVHEREKCTLWCSYISWAVIIGRSLSWWGDPYHEFCFTFH